MRFLQPSGNTWIEVPTPAEQAAHSTTRFGLEYLISLPDEDPRVQPGDTLTINLPEGIKGNSTKPLQLPTGETVANLVASGSTAVVTFTDNVSKFSKISLDVLVDVYVFEQAYPENTKKTITVGKSDYYFIYRGPTYNPNFFTKRGDAISRNVIEWLLFLNYSNNSVGVVD